MQHFSVWHVHNAKECITLSDTHQEEILTAELSATS